MSKATDKLGLAKRHLERVQGAWDEPTDWDDLSLYGFYCLEAAVEAAALYLRLGTSRKHWEKADIAVKLHKKHRLPDISKLLVDLNEARKAAAYGDTERPDLDAEGIAADIEEYVEAVEELLEGKNK
jgi:hypothetical protein